MIVHFVPSYDYREAVVSSLYGYEASEVYTKLKRLFKPKLLSCYVKGSNPIIYKINYSSFQLN